MPDIFLSYTRDDQATARRFAEAFERSGFSVWWDQTLSPGEAFDEVTERALEGAKAVVVLWSKKSVASRWVRAEATQANERSTLVPVTIEPCKRPIMFELTHTADLSQWKGDESDPAWQTFLVGVQRFVSRGKEGIVPPSQVSGVTHAAATSRVSRKRAYGGALLAALLIAAAAFWKFGPVREPNPGAQAAVTLAVLPFANLSSDPEQEYFSDGLTEEILNQLAQVKALQVTGRTSSFSFKGKNEDLRVIGEKLSVANLLEGSIRKDGNDLRITAQLIDARTGGHRWSRTYDRELSRVFVLQEEIAKDVAQALSVTLDVGDLPRAEGGTTNVDAYDRYLRARAFTQQLRIEEGTGLYREATQLDPMFWRAWYGLASTLAVTPGFAPSPQIAAAATQELANVRTHVIQAAPESWAKQTMMAAYYFERRDWPEYEMAANKALSELPASASLELIGLSLARIAVGRVREATEAMNRVSRAEPLDVGPSTGYQVALFYGGDLQSAEREYQRSRGLEGNHIGPDTLSLTRMMTDPKAAPEAILARFRALSEIYPEMKPGLPFFEALGNPDAARTVARNALQDPARQGAGPLSRLSVYADRAGDKDTALEALQRIAKLPPLGADPGMLWAPFRTGLRADPRFKQIVRNLGLVDYWRSTGNWGDYCKPVGTEDFECH